MACTPVRCDPSTGKAKCAGASLRLWRLNFCLCRFMLRLPRKSSGLSSSVLSPASETPSGTISRFGDISLAILLNRRRRALQSSCSAPGGTDHGSNENQQHCVHPPGGGENVRLPTANSVLADQRGANLNAVVDHRDDDDLVGQIDRI